MSNEPHEKSEEKESPAKRIVGETVTYTLAELHVQGILAGIAFIFHNVVSHDTIAIILTAGGSMIATRVIMKEKKLAFHLKRGVPRLVKKTEELEKIVWERKNF